MSRTPPSLPDARIEAALATLQELIRGSYPDATFSVFEGEDPDGTYLRATVDIDDADEVMDIIVDTLYELQVEQGLPVYVVPVQPLARVADQVRERSTPRLPRSLPGVVTG
ncbi:MAG: hypothetical protein ACRDJE_29455 [Dehalococcoidia bacterium]